MTFATLAVSIYTEPLGGSFSVWLFLRSSGKNQNDQEGPGRRDGWWGGGQRGADVGGKSSSSVSPSTSCSLPGNSQEPRWARPLLDCCPPASAIGHCCQLKHDAATSLWNVSERKVQNLLNPWRSAVTFPSEVLLACLLHHLLLAHT